MKKGIPILICFLLLLAGLALFMSQRKPSPDAPNAVKKGGEAPETSFSRIPEDAVILEGADELASELHSGEISPDEDIAILQQILFVYRQAYGENPQGGLNEEIVERLLGFNEMKVRFLPESFSYLNDRGELVDRWGSPYFFHPLSAAEMEIVSAGPDKQLWTEDDVTIQ